MKSISLNQQNTTANPMLPDLFSIGRIRRETRDTFTYELIPKERKKEFNFLPGQFNMLYILGNGEVPISISGNPDENEKLVHTVRIVGTVTKAMQRLKSGETIGVRGPFGSSWPVEKAIGNDVIVVAGGIGLAPLMPVLYKLISNRDKYGKVALLYGTRSPDDILFKKELEQWRSRFDLEVYITVDTAPKSWKGNIGVVTKLIRKASFDPYNTIAVACGPEVMMRFTGAELEKYEVPTDHIYISMERNMKCAVGLCGHCQLGPKFICKDGPVFRYDFMKPYLTKREI